MKTAYLSLGSNVDRDANLRGGLDALQETFGTLQVSSVYESAAVGFTGSPFYNLAVALDTDLEVADLVACLRDIEDHFGRDRSKPRFSDRTLDIDLLLLGRLCGEFGTVTLPRQELFEQAFVLCPLAEIAPGLNVPGTDVSLSQLWAAAGGSLESHEQPKQYFQWQGRKVPILTLRP